MVTICPSLFQQGYCLNDSCQHQHDTANFCAICNIALNTTAQYNIHVKTRAHLQVEAVSQWLKCVPCNRHYLRNSITQASHENSTRHIRLLARHPIDFSSPPVIEISTPPHATQCEACNSTIPVAQLAKHNQTNSHITRQRVFNYHNALARSQENQGGVEVSGPQDGVDFGICEPGENGTPVTSTIWIECVGQMSVSLMRVQTSSSFGAQPGFLPWYAQFISSAP